jgi:hypothetical protein
MLLSMSSLPTTWMPIQKTKTKVKRTMGEGEDDILGNGE